MREAHVTLPELGLIAGTRAALGAGIGLLLSDRMHPDERKAVGWTLVMIGALSTVPLAIQVLSGLRSQANVDWDDMASSGRWSDYGRQRRREIAPAIR